MPDISIKVDDSQVRALLSRAPNDINVAMRGASEDAGTYILAIQERYPPERPNQVYRRTKTLARSWGKKIEGSGANIRVTIFSSGNIAPYNRRVQDANVQSRIFRGRWINTVQHTAETQQNQVRRFYADRLRAAGY